MGITPKAEHIKSLNEIPDPATLLDDRFRIIAVNSAYKDIYHNGKDVTGKTCYQSSHGYEQPCDESGESCPLKSCINSKSTERMLHVHNLPGGKEYVDVETSPVKDEKGKIIYYREVLRQTLIASAEPKASGLVGISPSFIKMLEEIHKVARENVPVLLLGESGTGKELIARALHDASTRAGKPFVPVECSGLSEMLFESELFGHHKGAFTGALFEKEGLIEVAQGGTLFLDEIGDVPSSLQVKLLRLLESHTYRKVGETKTKQANFRLVCATNRDLEQMMEAGQFRQDLFYRISTFPVHLPPLRERREDIALLARSILLRISPDKKITLTKEGSDALSRHDFPGNIRELVNLLERARIRAGGTQLTSSHFSELFATSTNPQNKNQEECPIWKKNEKIISFKELESRYLSHLLKTFPGTQADLAAQLGMSQRTLTRKISSTVGKKLYKNI
ncbi:MAG: sigma-54-dependent Fis family transcriptional regulator [Magnetococcales bacterium]|nr:sigma-54-dependent Fis family transcriptional regulator [Magnetococcales bacterium]